MDQDELDNRFAYHPPSSPAVAKKHEEMRVQANVLAAYVNVLCPESREKSLALTACQEVMMWANAAIAIHQEGR